MRGRHYGMRVSVTSMCASHHGTKSDALAVVRVCMRGCVRGCAFLRAACFSSFTQTKFDVHVCAHVRVPGCMCVRLVASLACACLL